MTFRPLTIYSDFPPVRLFTNFMLWYRAWLSSNNEWFSWSIWNGYDMPAGTLLDTWFRPLFGTCLCSSCWENFSRIRRIFSWHFTLNTHLFFLDFALGSKDSGHIVFAPFVCLLTTSYRYVFDFNLHHYFDMWYFMIGMHISQIISYNRAPVGKCSRVLRSTSVDSWRFESIRYFPY